VLGAELPSCRPLALQRADTNPSSYTSTANLPVSLALVSWLTQSHGVLRVAQTSHERVRAGPHDERPDYEEWVDEAGGAVQRMYRVKDHVVSRGMLLA
jgi:hypothetical protein